MKSPKKPWRLWIEVLIVTLCPVALYWATEGDWRFAAFMTLVYVGTFADRRLRYRRFVANGGEAAAKKVRAMEPARKRRSVWVDVLAVVLLTAGFYWAWGNLVAFFVLALLVMVASAVEQSVRYKRFFASCKAASAEQS